MVIGLKLFLFVLAAVLFGVGTFVSTPRFNIVSAGLCVLTIALGLVA